MKAQHGPERISNASECRPRNARETMRTEELEPRECRPEYDSGRLDSWFLPDQTNSDAVMVSDRKELELGEGIYTFCYPGAEQREKKKKNAIFTSVVILHEY